MKLDFLLTQLQLLDQRDLWHRCNTYQQIYQRRSDKLDTNFRFQYGKLYIDVTYLDIIRFNKDNRMRYSFDVV